jgi:(2Fe-2S) ferredoxin
VAVTVSDCLGPCERRDVVVVRPSRSGRAHGGRPVWLGWADDRVSEAVQAWVRVGGPGHALLPALLELHQFAAPAPVGR